MTHKIFVLVGYLILFSLVSFGGCWPYQFGQLATDWYRGMSIPTIESFYFTKGKIMSLVGDCHPKSQYIFAWEDGFYIWGIYAGNGLNQCQNVACPQPYLNPNERIVFVSAEQSSSGTRFIVDSVKWDSSGFGYFNFDRTDGVVHEAGILLPPKVKSSSVIVRGITDTTVEIPIPKKGYYSDPDINPASLIAGIAIYVKISDTAPNNLHPYEFQLLKAVPVNLENYSNILNPVLVTEVRIPVYYEGKAYISYTLILNDGTEAPLENKLTLPLTSPATCLSQSFRNATDLRLDSTDIERVNTDIDVNPSVAPISFVKAVKNGNRVELEIKVSGNMDSRDLEILRSYDLVNWQRLSEKAFVSGEDLRTTDVIDYEPELGVFYEIHLKDSETGNDIYILRTRARDTSF